VAPEQVVGVHVNYLSTRLAPDIELSEVDEDRLDKVRQLMANRPPYQALQALTPQTIGYALTDSPVGQLVWIAERFAQWTGQSSTEAATSPRWRYRTCSPTTSGTSSSSTSSVSDGVSVSHDWVTALG
jgi:hypothetical protein